MSSPPAALPFDFRALFEQSPFSTVIYDSQGRILAANAAFERFWGVSVDTAPPDYSVLTDPELERQGALPVIRRAFDGETIATPPVRYDISRLSTTGAGRTVWTQGHFYPVRDAAGRVTQVVLVHVDLTARVEAEEALRLSEERFRTALRGSLVVTSSQNRDLRYTWMHNPALGDRVREVIGKRDMELCDRTLDAEAMEAIKRKVLRTGEGDRREVLVYEGGRPRYYDLTVDPLRDGDGEIVGVICAQIDVTERRLADAALREAKETAEAASRAKSDFLAVMSHELRTPLNAIAGYVELLQVGVRGALTPAQLADLERIRVNQRRLLGLINDVLNYAKVDAGRVEYDIRPTPMREALDATEPVIQPLAAAKGIAFAVETCDAALLVSADPDKVQQVLVNLLSNAIKFTEPGGRVSVACDDDHAARVVRVRVRDTGVGIPADRLASVFDPFVQVDTRLTRTAGGTGLGLAISRDLARGMGGELTAESRVGEGSTFTLTLPRA